MGECTVKAWKEVLKAINKAATFAGRDPDGVTLVAVSKTHSPDVIEPVLAAGQRVFGENRVQEAKAKWPGLRDRYPGITLHLIGPLQSNKVADAVELFDVIETVDRDKIAGVLAAEIRKQNKTPELFVQVNTGNEPQKAGIEVTDLPAFLTRISTQHGLSIAGLMCIPPLNDPPEKHFRLLAKLAKDAGLRKVSMGMSGDFEQGIAAGATHVRVGSAIFGTRVPLTPGQTKA